jgi:acyl-CoA-binding protein
MNNKLRLNIEGRNWKELEKDFKQKMDELKELCEHPSLTRWEYPTWGAWTELDGKVIEKIQYKECKICGKEVKERHLKADGTWEEVHNEI